MKTLLLALLKRPVLIVSPFQRKKLKLRFEINQAEAFRRGVDYHKSIVTLDIDPVTLSPEAIELLEPRLFGIDVCECAPRADGSKGPRLGWEGRSYDDPRGKEIPHRLVASLPTFEALIEAASDDEHRLQAKAKITGRLLKV